MSVGEITAASLVRGVQADGWIRLVHRSAAMHNIPRAQLEQELLDSLLAPLLRPAIPPLVLFEYTRRAVQDGVVSPRTLLRGVLSRVVTRAGGGAKESGSVADPGALETLCRIVLDAPGEQRVWAAVLEREGQGGEQRENGKEASTVDKGDDASSPGLEALLGLLDSASSLDSSILELVCAVAAHSPGLRVDPGAGADGVGGGSADTTRRIQRIVADEMWPESLRRELGGLLPGGTTAVAAGVTADTGTSRSAARMEATSPDPLGPLGSLDANVDAGGAMDLDAAFPGTGTAAATGTSDAFIGVPAQMSAQHGQGQGQGHIALALRAALATGWYTSPPPSPPTRNVASASASSDKENGPSFSPAIPRAHIQLLQLGPVLSSRPSAFAHHLVQASLEAMLGVEERASAAGERGAGDGGDGVGAGMGGNGENASGLDVAGLSGEDVAARDEHLVGRSRTGVRETLWALEGLWRVLAWWRDHAGEKGWEGWAFPTTLAQTLHLVLPPLQERITLYDARMAARFSRLTDESGMGGSGAGAGAGDGMDVDLGFDFMAFGSGEVAPVSPPEGLLVSVGQALSRHGLLSDEVIAELGLPTSSGEEAATLSECVAADKGQHDAIVLKLLTSPDLSSRIVGEIHHAFEDFAGAPDGLILLLLNHAAMLDLVCHVLSPAAFYGTLLDCLTACLEGSQGREDPQILLARCGGLVNLLEVVCWEYKLPLPARIAAGKRVYALDALSPSEQDCLAGWIKALFGSGGIDDDILQATTPARLLKLAATIVTQACLAVQDGIISGDVLRGGLSYFAQPLLSWCTGVAVDCLCADISRQGLQALSQLEALSALVVSESLQSRSLAIRQDAIQTVLGHAGAHDIARDGIIDLQPMQGVMMAFPQAANLEISSEVLRAAMQELLNPLDTHTLGVACDTVIREFDLRSMSLLNAILEQAHVSGWGQQLRRLCAGLLLLAGPSFSVSCGVELVMRLIKQRTRSTSAGSDQAISLLLAALVRLGEAEQAERIANDLLIDIQRNGPAQRSQATNTIDLDPLLKDDFLQAQFAFWQTKSTTAA